MNDNDEPNSDEEGYASENEAEVANLPQDAKASFIAQRALKHQFQEDRALLAVLAQRRRSLEASKTGGTSKVGFSDAHLDRAKIQDGISRGRNRIASMRFQRELMQKKKKMHQQHESEFEPQEMYTDKMRAAAVLFGEQDIKASIKEKEKSEHGIRVMLPEELDSNIYMTEAKKCILQGNIEVALYCANKAIENNQFDPRSLLVRSRCYLILGRFQEASKDAQEALKTKPTLVKALLVQAEALYGMGEFERALVLFHRGRRRRPDLDDFRKGIQKAKSAILNAIGGAFPQLLPPSNSPERLSLNPISASSTVADSTLFKKKKDPTHDSFSYQAPTLAIETRKSKSKTQTKPMLSKIETSKAASKRLLGGLNSDKEFLSRLLERKSLRESEPDVLLWDFQSNRKNRRPRISKGKEESEESPSALSLPEVNHSPMENILVTAQEALSSLQKLETFLWQRDPDTLAPNHGRATAYSKLPVSRRISGLSTPMSEEIERSIKASKSDERRKRKGEDVSLTNMELYLL